MKKLMIAAAVALTGIALNATTYNWSAAADLAMKSASPEAYVEYCSVYFFDANAVSMSDITTKLAKGDFSGLNSALASGTTDDVGGFGLSGTGDVASGTTGITAKDNTVYGAIIFLDSDETSSATQFWTTSTSTALIGTAATGGNTELSFGELDATSNWQDIKTEDVPEPTSGLLLLLGMAGLALKRKRA